YRQRLNLFARAQYRRYPCSPVRSKIHQRLVFAQEYVVLPHPSRRWSDRSVIEYPRFVWLMSLLAVDGMCWGGLLDMVDREISISLNLRPKRKTRPRGLPVGNRSGTWRNGRLSEFRQRHFCLSCCSYQF